MQVDPQLSSNVVFHTRVFFIMQSIQCATDYGVHLRTEQKETWDKSNQDNTSFLDSQEKPVDEKVPESNNWIPTQLVLPLAHLERNDVQLKH